MSAIVYILLSVLLATTFGAMSIDFYKGVKENAKTVTLKIIGYSWLCVIIFAVLCFAFLATILLCSLFV